MKHFIKRIAILTGMSRSLKLALIVRADLKLTKGKTAAQCSHAAIMCYEKAMQKNPKLLKEWIYAGQPKIVLKVDNIVELDAIMDKAKHHGGIVAEMVCDAGRTQVEAGTVTVLGLGPHYDNTIDTFVQHLKLL